VADLAGRGRCVDPMDITRPAAITTSVAKVSAPHLGRSLHVIVIHNFALEPVM